MRDLEGFRVSYKCNDILWSCGVVEGLKYHLGHKISIFKVASSSVRFMGGICCCLPHAG